jgi:hypothetical protein
MYSENYMNACLKNNYEANKIVLGSQSPDGTYPALIL